VLVQLQLSWTHGGLEINWLKLHDILKINPRIRNCQKHKNPNQALHEDSKKSLKEWRSLAKPRREEQKIGPCGFLYLYDRR